MTSPVSAAPRTVCVLGFGRSGTSLVTHLLGLLGVELGPEEDLLPPVADDNARGYWEPAWMVDLNDEILAALGTTWFEPMRTASGWERRPELSPLRDRARALLGEKFGAAPRWGWKDPRTTLTLPFWRDLVPDAAYVICVRNPADAIASIQRRPQPALSTSRWGAVWLEYTARALMETVGRPRLLVFYDDVVFHGRAEIERLSRFLGADGIDHDRVFEAIEPELRHHRTSLTELASRGDIPPEARTAYLALRSGEDARRRGADGPELADAVEAMVPILWRSGLEHAERLEAEQHEGEAARSRIDELTQRLREREQELATVAHALHVIRSSRSWRLTEPLRAGARRLRSYRGR
jgi:hypothetical protein